jgi:predicted nucleotidyltransferase
MYTVSEISHIVSPIARTYGINRLYVLGSYARGDAIPDIFDCNVIETAQSTT